MLLVGLMAAWASLHLIITTLSATRFADLMFFLVLPSLMYIMYLVIRYHSDSLGFIRRFLTVFVLFVALPPFVELLTGIQLTTASGEELAIESGAVKGLFFNPNNLATAAVCLAPAVLFFFNISVRKPRIRCTAGYCSPYWGPRFSSACPVPPSAATWFCWPPT